MRRYAMLPLLSLLIVLPAAAPVAQQDAKTLAQEILSKGSTLFDTQDAAAMAATYAEDGHLSQVDWDKDSGKYRSVTKEGRSAIEAYYRDVFKDASQKTTSRNTVEFAKLVAPDLVVIHGAFEPYVGKPDKYSFVQERAKQGDKWLITNLRLYIILKD